MDIRIKKSPEALRELGQKLLLRVKAVSDDVKGIKGVWGALGALPILLTHVQLAGEEWRLVNEDKKALAVQLVLDLVPDRWVPDAVIEPIVGWAIERALAAAKKAGWPLLEALKKKLGLA